MTDDPERAFPAPTIAEDAVERRSASTQAASVEAPAPAPAAGPAPAPAEGASAEPQEARSRKKRLQLSCGECRRKKLSCDRGRPCRRCVRTGRADQCEFETNPRSAQLPIDQGAQLEQIKSDQAELQSLRTEISQLKELLSRPPIPQHGRGSFAEEARVGDFSSKRSVEVESKDFVTINRFPNSSSDGPPDPREKSPRGYYRRHTLLRFFSEIPQLFPFIKEIADQWLKPYGIYIKKNKAAKDESWRMKMAASEQPLLEGLLPPKHDTDVLIAIYLDHFEQLHRIVHIPTFNREYINFWTPGRPRYPTMAAMILAMISVSVCASVHLVGSSPVPTNYRKMAEMWISSIDDWLRLQSTKHRKLVHYQVASLMYIAKRMNLVGKKKFWKDTGSMMQDAVMDGLNRDPSLADTFFIREMKRRLWYTVRELELQNSFECGLPTLLHTIESNVTAPLNLADEDFDDTTKLTPMSRPSSSYTESSYQFHSFRSWELRLELSRRQFGSGVFRALDYDDVLRYTHEITRALKDLPPWINGRTDGKSDGRVLLSYSMLEFQLKECLLAIHRPYVDRDGKYPLSETICYQTAREILLSNIQLANFGVQSLTQLREDLAIASLHMTRLTLMQPEGSNSIIMANALATVDLLEQCLPLIEDKYLRFSDPWNFFIMCTAIMLIKIHLGKETRQTAKSSCARRFLDLYYKSVWMHHPSDLAQQQAISRDIANQTNAAAACPPAPPPEGSVLPTSVWLDNSYPDIGNDPFDLSVEMDVWDEAGFPLPGFPNC
ncbi:hypothetical protein BBK36DRAFT_1173759 [Trichoderma citrinoviride]|uniref:Zn(2)-C6 fungal-type domain-containing protein n=1 Tax=Trichoderma citrinoviride TaxID=58853 RepID=A0A2T4BLZ4_9HYPO|nr:hypothetical protein BBK36DRAFT_1173759 [Trichoderma citrinoviride]PTB70290.1 hypothetical protein BBK36DRAFT_1173759 [Trichoderma citrinoviride]